MYIKTEQEFIFGGSTKSGQWVLVEPKTYKKMFLLAPKEEIMKELKVQMVDDKKYIFDLTVMVDVISDKVQLHGKTEYLNKVKFYINDVKEVVVEQNGNA